MPASSVAPASGGGSAAFSRKMRLARTRCSRRGLRTTLYSCWNLGGRPCLRSSQQLESAIMRPLATILFAFWVLLASPILCVAGVVSHSCGCDESACPECQGDHCQKSHDCHDDPCPQNLVRLDPGDSGVNIVRTGLSASMADDVLIGFPAAFSALPETLLGCLPAHSESHPESCFATVNLPLLI